MRPDLRSLASIFLILTFAPADGLPQQPAEGETREGPPPPTVVDPSAPLPSNYDPYADPNHPLKGDEDPGHAWDAGNMNDWNGDHGGRGTPGIRNAVGSWDWGELLFDRTYPGKLTVRNKCESPQVVNVFVYDLPYLQGLPDEVPVPALDSVEVSMKIVTPPEPDPPVNPTPFDPTAPGFGWVEPPNLPPRPNPFDPTAPEWHQPNFVPVDGRVVLWHPWTGNCLPRRVTYEAAGHIHWDAPDEEAEDRGPEETAKPDPCAVYWNTGQPPPDLEGRDCTETFRGLAIAFLEKILHPRTEEDPEAWAWLPSAAELQSMSVEGLLAFKQRAAAILDSESESE